MFYSMPHSASFREMRSNFNCFFLAGKESIPKICQDCVNNFLLVAVVAVCRRRLDLGILIDGSGSIELYGRGNFRQCLNFVQRLVASFGISPKQTRVGVVLFAHRAWLIANFRRYRNKQSVLRAISRIRYPRGGTKIGRALRFARYRLFRRRTNRRKVSV